MNKEETFEIIDLLKSGKQFKQGHYISGYVYYFYNKEKNCFVEKTEDMGIDMYNPSVEEKEYQQNQFIEKFLLPHPFKEFKSFLI